MRKDVTLRWYNKALPRLSIRGLPCDTRDYFTNNSPLPFQILAKYVFSTYSIPGHLIATNLCTCDDSYAVVTSAKFGGNRALVAWIGLLNFTMTNHSEMDCWAYKSCRFIHWLQIWSPSKQCGSVEVSCAAMHCPCQGSISLRFFLFQFNENLFPFDPNSNLVIPTKFCSWHNSCAAMVCAKFCSNLFTRNRIKAKRIFHQIRIVKQLVKFSLLPFCDPLTHWSLEHVAVNLH